MSINRIENVKYPIKKGELYLVPCIVKQEEQKEFITPIINHPHNDIENGQKEIHYHADFRFIKLDSNGFVKRAHSKHFFLHETRPVKYVHGELMYIILPVINENFEYITAPTVITKSKLKHTCIYKGKCPHRGYDLSQVKPINGIVRCPLHGLEFCEKTKQLLNHKNK